MSVLLDFASPSIDEFRAVKEDGKTMVQSTVTYQGDLHCAAQHGPSGGTLDTDAPVDNNGRGQSFSPTDLVATALGSCMLTIMGIVASSLDVDLKGAVASVDKNMVADPQRRIGQLAVKIKVPGDVSPENRKTLEEAAHTCPVAKSIHPDIDVPVLFEWG